MLNKHHLPSFTAVWEHRGTFCRQFSIDYSSGDMLLLHPRISIFLGRRCTQHFLIFAMNLSVSVLWTDTRKTTKLYWIIFFLNDYFRNDHPCLGISQMPPPPPASDVRLKQLALPLKELLNRTQPFPVGIGCLTPRRISNRGYYLARKHFRSWNVRENLGVPSFLQATPCA